MRSRRVILRLAPYVLTFGFLGSTMVWQNVATDRVSEDTGTPDVVVDQFAVPTVTSDVPVDPIPSEPGATDSATGEGGPEVEPDGTVDASKGAPIVIAELTPRDMDPFALVGVTWESGVPASATVSVRWRGKDGWSDWEELHQEDGTSEGRPGTEPRWVEWADAAAVRVTSPVRSVPKDLKIATVDPGDVRGIAPAAVAQPGIIMRSQWGARSQSGCSSPIYGPATNGAVIHHTVGSNNYQADQSASIVRSIQAYHMDGQHWCDIGYNFLVDRYGQIFEGRAGGIASPVRAAHSGDDDVNQQTVGVSLMGTFSSSAPTDAMKSATAQLVAWRFSLAGIPAIGTVNIGGKTLNRISGHRDVISTECPGTYVYNWLSAGGGLRDTVASIIATGGPPALPATTGLRLKDRTTTTIDYAWNRVTDAPKYVLQVSRTSDFGSHRTIKVSDHLAQVADLKPGTKFFARVRAIRSDGSRMSAWSSTLVVWTKPPDGTAGIPQSLQATSRTESSLGFTWGEVNHAARYEIQLSRSATMTSPSTKSVTKTDTNFRGLSSGTTYDARVRAFDSSGSMLGRWSEIVAAQTVVDSNSTAAKAVPASGSYTFQGHGFGHGIGMGQYGAAGAASSGKTYWPILNHYYSGATQGDSSGRIRVLITADTTRNVKVKGQDGIQFQVGTADAEALPTSISGKTVERWSIEQLGGDNSGLKYRTNGDWHTFKTWAGPSAQFEGPTLQLILPDDSVRTYRGALVSAQPSPGSSGRDTINVLSLEKYVRGVVPREMPSSWPAEALKAQAVVARTYGARAIRTTSYYDVCDTTACQVYGGVAAERENTDAAVAATAHEILTYGGAPAFTQYSASTGGYSDKGSQPYLAAVSDPWDDWSGNSRHSWSAAVSAATIQSKYPGIGTLKSLQVTSRNGYGDWGGRVTGLKLVGSKATKTITGNEARSAFGLRSNWFTF